MHVNIKNSTFCNVINEIEVEHPTVGWEWKKKAFNSKIRTNRRTLNEKKTLFLHPKELKFVICVFKAGEGVQRERFEKVKRQASL